MFEKEIIFSIVFGGLVVALLFILLLSFLLYYIKNKNKFIRERDELQSRFRIELAKAELEIQEETLKHIAYELHDNIGQLVTLAKIQTQSLIKNDDNQGIQIVHDSISKALEEIRRLSKSLDVDFLNDYGLTELILKECDHINQLEVFRMEYETIGIPYEIESQKKIILYRVIQELLSNAVKHSKCNLIKVACSFLPGELEIIISDNGIGFDAELFTTQENFGLGLRHIRERIQLINGRMELTSSPVKGTTYKLNCPN